MQNYKDDNTGGTYNNFRIKIFSGIPEVVEKDIMEFINSEPMIIDKVLQSESAASGEYSITITVFYYTQEPARFIAKGVAIDKFASDVYDHFTKQYDIDFFDVLNLIEKEIEKRKNT